MHGIGTILDSALPTTQIRLGLDRLDDLTIAVYPGHRQILSLRRN
jgi:hypothetical protein